MTNECNCEYAKAVRAAHNGYDAASREAMPGLQRPATPAAAIRELLKEASELGVANGKALLAEALKVCEAVGKFKHDSVLRKQARRVLAMRDKQ